MAAASHATMVQPGSEYDSQLLNPTALVDEMIVSDTTAYEESAGLEASASTANTAGMDGVDLSYSIETVQSTPEVSVQQAGLFEASLSLSTDPLIQSDVGVSTTTAAPGYASSSNDEWSTSTITEFTIDGTTPQDFTSWIDYIFNATPSAVEGKYSVYSLSGTLDISGAVGAQIKVDFWGITPQNPSVYTPVIGASFAILHYAAVTGNVSNVTLVLPALPTGLNWYVNWGPLTSPGSLTLTVIGDVIPEPGTAGMLAVLGAWCARRGRRRTT